jgi:hypothetical protein
MFRRSALLLAIFLLASLAAMAVPTARAQQPQSLKYGDSVDGEITNDAFEVPYRLSGKRGDVLIAQIIPVKDDKGEYMTSFILRLLDRRDKKVADTSDVLSFNYTRVLGVELPEDGDYTLIATRRDGKDGKEVGKYALTLTNAPKLVAGQAVKGTATQFDAGRYHAFYALESRDEFTLKYKRNGAGFTALIAVSHLEAGYLFPDAVLTGQKVAGATITLAGSRDIFVVSVSDPGLSTFYRDKATLDYELTFDEGIGGLPK